MACIDINAETIKTLTTGDLLGMFEDACELPHQELKGIIANELESRDALTLWKSGFPSESAHHLVELSDGEMCVTPWGDGSEPSRTGWYCLTHSRSTVKRWIPINNLRKGADHD